MNKDQALAICFANLKGRKDKDLLATAEALAYLKRLPEYGSNARVGRAVGVSAEIVREFLTLLDLPSSLQRLFRSRELRLEHSRRLWQLQRSRPEVVEDMAAAMRGMTAHDARSLVEHVLRHPELKIREAKLALLSSKTKTSDEFHIVALVDDDEYRELSRRAKKRRLTVDELVSSVIKEWLHPE